METENLEIALKDFRDYVIKQSRANLSRLKKNSSKTLYQSLKGNYKASSKEFDVMFEMAYYGQFIDWGVSGKKVKYNTPFSYKSKMPPPNKLDKWIVRKGIAPRDKKGKFLTRKQTQFLIARGIYRNGIKPSLFFTKPYMDGLKRLPNELVKHYGMDIDEYLNTILNKLSNG
jgi:hypothetical protein